MTSRPSIRRSALQIGVDIAARMRAKETAAAQSHSQVESAEPIRSPNAAIRGDIDITYHMQQRDMFQSGLAAAIGAHAFSVWHAIKSHANFQTGVAWPGMRRLAKICGISDKTVQSAIRMLVIHHLLRVSKHGRKNVYVARERVDIRVSGIVICTIVIDYQPARMKKRLACLQNAVSGANSETEIWMEVELIPGPGMRFDAVTRTFKCHAPQIRVANAAHPPDT